tara:strand:+ start:3039 stop:3659 length:621 start_codon:yes stop_codon:yes gene_type:complete
MFNLAEFTPNLVAIFVFVLIVSGNFLAELFPCQVQRIFSNNMIVKHLFGFMTLLFFVVLTIPEIKDQKNMIGYTSIVYLWFIMMAKCYYTLWFVVFGLVGLIYLLQMYERHMNKNTDGETNNETEDETENKEINEKKLMIEKGKRVLTISVVGSTILGFLMYMGAKKMEYKKSFNYFTFLFGKPRCRGDRTLEHPGYINLLKHAFK